MNPTDGGYYEDVEVGEEVVSPGRTITETDVVNFAGLSGDFNVIHMDADLMNGTPFGQRIAHGLLGLAIASGLVTRTPGGEQLRVVAFLGTTWDIRKPIFIGDTIHVVKTVASKRETSKPGLGIVVFDAKVINQRGELCQEGQWKLMCMMRSVAPASPE